MSGGSLEYLFSAHWSGGLTPYLSQLTEAASQLRELGEDRAAAETEKVVAAMEEINVAAARLQEVWRAVEWMISGDSLADSVHEACAKLAPRDNPEDAATRLP